MNFSSIVAGLVSIAEKVAPFVPHGEEGVAIVKAVTDTIDDVKTAATEINDTDAVAQLEAARTDFEAAVNAHLDKTIDSLGPTPTDD